MEGEVKEEEEEVLGTGESSRRGNEGEGGECVKAREACVEPSSCSSTSSASSSADRIQLGERGLEGIPRAACIPTGPLPELCAKVYHLPEGCRRERPSIPDSDGSRETSLREMSGDGAGGAVPFREAVGRREGSLRRMSGDAAGGTRPFREAGSREESLTAMSGYGTTGARPFIEVGDGDVDVFDWLQTLSSYADWLRHRQRRDHLEHEGNNLHVFMWMFYKHPFASNRSVNENVIATTAPATATQGGVPAATATVGIAVAPVSAPVSTSLTPVAASTSIPSVAPTRVSTGTDPITLDTPCDASVPTTAVTSLRHHVNASSQTFPARDTALTRVPATESTFSSVAPCSVDAGYVNRTPAVVSAGNDPFNSHSNHGAVLPLTVISPRPVVDASSQTSPSLANSFALPPNISTGPTAVPSPVSTITDGSSDRAPAVVSTGTDPFNSVSDHAAVRSATIISPRPMADACSQTFTSTPLAPASSTVSSCSTVVPSSVSSVSGGFLNHTLTFASTGTDSFDVHSDQATVKSATIISPRSVADASSQTNSTCPTGAPFPISSIKGDSSDPAPACVSVGTGTEPVPSVSHASVSTSISIPCRAKDAGSQTQEHEEFFLPHLRTGQ
ncbi:Protein of unknown function [Gryllus bimaculatus]|nr:Protein of unknown function [Gryllus bimaculatus]